MENSKYIEGIGDIKFYESSLNEVIEKLLSLKKMH